MKQIVISGWIEENWDDRPSINDTAIHRILNHQLQVLGLISNNSSCYDKDDDESDCIITNCMVDNAFIQMHVSDREISLDEANSDCILMSLGELDIYERWYGYSEWTILGYDVESFKLIGHGGEHDLESILSRYIGKYLNMVVTIKEQE